MGRLPLSWRLEWFQKWLVTVYLQKNIYPMDHIFPNIANMQYTQAILIIFNNRFGAKISPTRVGLLPSCLNPIQEQGFARLLLGGRDGAADSRQIGSRDEAVTLKHHHIEWASCCPVGEGQSLFNI